MVPKPPTSVSLGLPAPFSPWQAWHFAANTASPSFGVPRPGGSPAPSGPTLMSQGARSAGEIGCPKRGASAAPAKAAVANRIAAPRARTSRERIGRLPFLVDAPAGDGVVVILAAQPAGLDELRARRLHHAGVVGGAALQHGGTAVPFPGGAKARERLRQDRFLQDRLRPAC